MIKKLTLSLVLALFVASASFAATISPVEIGRSHTATGAFGCTVTGATNATPIVVTCSAAHNFIDGDAIQITGVVGNTAANANGYAKRTSYSSTTFGLYSDANLTTGIAGNGSWSSGGVATMAYPISSFTGDWTLRVSLETLTNAKNVTFAIETSADGFVSDIRTIMVGGSTGATGSARGQSTYILRQYQFPSSRFGVSNVCLRLKIQAIDSSTTANYTVFLEQ